MTKPIEELREELDGISRFGHDDIYKSRTDQIIQAFLKWCEKENIVQVVEGELPENWLTDPANYAHEIGFYSSNEAYGESQKDMLKWHKQSLKPVSSLLGGEKK